MVALGGNAYPAVAILRYKDPDRPRPFKIPGGDRLVVALAAIPSVIILGGVVLFLWPEIPNAPREWSYTGPLLGIVGLTLVAGEVMLWRMSHPRQPRTSPVAIQKATQQSAGGQL